MTQVFDDDRLEEIAEFIKEELGRLLGRLKDDDSPMSRHIQKRYGKVTTAERVLATLWALNEIEGNAILALATLDIEDHGFQVIEPSCSPKK